MRGVLLCSAVVCALVAGHAEDKLFVATPLTKPGEFTAGIEGPVCDAEGNVYVVIFKKEETIGRITPEGKGEVWVTLPGKVSATASSLTVRASCLLLTTSATTF